MRTASKTKPLPIPNSAVETRRQIKLFLAKNAGLIPLVELSVPGFMFASVCCEVRDSALARQEDREFCASLVKPLQRVQVAPFAVLGKKLPQATVGDALRVACDAGVYALFGDEPGANANLLLQAAVYWVEEMVAKGTLFIDEALEMEHVMINVKRYLVGDFRSAILNSRAAYDLAGRMMDRLEDLGLYR